MLDKAITVVQLIGVGITVIIFFVWLYTLLFWNNENVLKKNLITSYDKEKESVLAIAEGMENCYEEYLYYDVEYLEFGDERSELGEDCCDAISELLNKKRFVSITKDGSKVFFLKYERFKHGYGLLYSKQPPYNIDYINSERIEDYWYFYED